MSKNVVYHYCRFKGLKGIVESHEMRFSDLNSMDDPNELRYLWENYISKAEGAGISITKGAYNRQMENMIYFSLSLTKNPNSAFMWRLYADGGKGFAIGFDEDKLNAWRKNIHGSCNGWGVKNGLDVYGGIKYLNHRKNDCEEDYDSAVYGKVDYLNQKCMDELVNSVINADKEEEARSYGYMEILLNAPFIKMKSFKSENEYRVLITLWREMGEDIVYPFFCRYTPRDAENEQIIEMRMNDENFPIFQIPFENDMIKSILLGPYCDYDEKFIALMLRRNGYVHDIEVKKTDVR